jgi:hypothetical protein
MLLTIFNNLFFQIVAAVVETLYRIVVPAKETGAD